MTRVIGVRGGRLIEFTHCDEGEIEGAYVSRFEIEGKTVRSAWRPAAVPEQWDPERWAFDLATLAAEGFDPRTVAAVEDKS